MSSESRADTPGAFTLLESGRRVDVDVDDVDGRLYMLDRDWGGRVPLTFSRLVDPRRPGSVLLDGEPVDHIVKPQVPGSSASRLGVRTFGVLTERGREHALHVEGFAAADGTVMEPADVVLVTRPRPERDARYVEHDRVAQQVAEDGAVLLRNERDVLPLGPGVLNVLGSGLEHFRTTAVGAGKINPRWTVRLREAIEEHPGFELNTELAEFHRRHGDVVPDAALLARARERSDLALVVLTRASGENSDNAPGPGEFALTPGEDAVLRAAAEGFDRTVVVLNTPYPVDVRFVERYGIDAVLLVGLGGMAGGPAVLRVLDGSVNPSGRLPDTWPLRLADLPAHANFAGPVVGGARLTGDSDVWIDTVYEEGLYVGYRWATTFGADVAYPFGHGLGYTGFEVRPDGVDVDADGLRVRARVTNTGRVPGREVVQVYVSKPDGILEQVDRDLVGFAKSRLLGPGEHEDVTVDVPVGRLAAFDDGLGAWVVVAGEHVVHVGQSSVRTREAARVALPARTLRTVRARVHAPEPVRALSRRAPEGTWPSGARSGIKPGIDRLEPLRAAVPAPAVQPGPAPGSAVTFAQVQDDPALAARFVAGLDVEQLARLTVCGETGWGLEGTGVAGILARPDGVDLPLFQVADGNSGVNVTTPNIGMPTTVVLAATFDTELADAVGRVIGEEAREFDVHLVLAPALNLHRHPLNGRHPEYFSEDPVLAGVMAGHYARGLESTGVGACYKHVAANNAESARKRNQSLVPERALRELYLRAFEVALSVHHPQSAMSAYNALNGRPAAGDVELHEGVLRQELGFTGTIMTDWSSYDTCDVVDMVLAGHSWITPGSADDSYTEPLVRAVRDGRLPVEHLRAAVTTLLTTVARLTPEPARTEGPVA